jgi:hypothetical protein
MDTSPEEDQFPTDIPSLMNALHQYYSSLSDSSDRHHRLFTQLRTYVDEVTNLHFSTPLELIDDPLFTSSGQEEEEERGVIGLIVDCSSEGFVDSVGDGSASVTSRDSDTNNNNA